MARTTTAVCKLCRREGEKLFLKGERCFTQKCAVTRRGYPPGQHGLSRRRRQSEYGTQLREKQKVKRIYGIFEKQFRRYFAAAERGTGVTGDSLLQSLERRLDSVVYRSHLVPSRPLSRQLIRHGHITINDQRVDIPSYAISAGDVIGVGKTEVKQDSWQERFTKINPKDVPSWLTWDSKAHTITVDSLPTATDVEQKLNMQLIIELYSR